MHTQTAKKKGTIPKFNPRGALSLPLASVGTNPGSMSAISLMFLVSPKLCGIDSKTTVSPWQNEACSEQARCCQRRNPMAHNPLEASARAGPPLAGPRAETFTKLPFGVTSAEVVINCPDFMYLSVGQLSFQRVPPGSFFGIPTFGWVVGHWAVGIVGLSS